MVLILVGAYSILSWIWLITKRAAGGSNRSGLFVTVYEWEHALLYINGRFSRFLPPGRYFNFTFGKKRDVYTLSKHSQFIVTAPVDVTSRDKLPFRLMATITYEIVDPREAFEGQNHDFRLRLSVTNALIRFAAEQVLDEFMTERVSLDQKLLEMLEIPVSGCAIKSATITSVTLPPEIRRMFTETERAKLEGLATLERARGEHAALRSLANAARMLKGNPELMNLRILQALSTSNGKRPPTLVLGQGSLLPISNHAEVAED